jgi:uncharacterized RDD family membrane protein YckC
MENEFTAVMANHSNQQLIAIVTSDRGKYQALAIEAAEREIAARGINAQQYHDFHAQSIDSAKKQLDFEMRYADGGLRVANLLIDSIAIVILYVIALVGLLIMGMEASDESWAPMLIYLFVYFAYYISMESAWQQTLGKMITKTKVVTMLDEVPSNGDIVARTLCRMIPFDWISFLFTRQGFHDSISKTTVVQK